jgi:hypothetical protein
MGALRHLLRRAFYSLIRAGGIALVHVPTIGRPLKRDATGWERGDSLPSAGTTCENAGPKEIYMPQKLALLAVLLLAACNDGPVQVDRSLERGTALAPPGVNMAGPPPVGPDKR